MGERTGSSLRGTPETKKKLLERGRNRGGLWFLRRETEEIKGEDREKRRGAPFGELQQKQRKIKKDGRNSRKLLFSSWESRSLRNFLLSSTQRISEYTPFTDLFPESVSKRLNQKKNDPLDQTKAEAKAGSKKLQEMRHPPYKGIESGFASSQSQTRKLAIGLELSLSRTSQPSRMTSQH